MSKDSLAHKTYKMVQRRRRARRKIQGTAERPRLSVHISNKHASAQLIDDDSGRTIAYATTVGQKDQAPLSEKAAWTGSEIAKKAHKAKIKSVVFDRGERKYHGRVKQLADAARSEGLEF
ncbi:MAG TPA: 50S ribosomal protein L18 [Candidatus Saccharimonadales bacterium]|nr:50S ribosomal protein L18 [Candidatus Saccharimonadales bacterium]